MSTEHNDNTLEREGSDSDDGFEVLDPEPEEEPDDFKYLSRTEFKNAGTIIFCHMNDEFDSIQQVRCQYIRPEGWTEQEKDAIAIFEVGWINTEEAIARLHVDLSISPGYPLGSVNLTDFSFRKEDYAEFPGAVSHFQFCYLRDGVLLGASTPFGIRGIKAVGRIPLMGEKPIFLPSGQFTADRDPAVLYELEIQRNLSQFETSAVNIPSYKHNHDKFFLENEAAHEMSEGSVGVELSTLRSTLRNLTALTKRLQNCNIYDKTRTSEYSAEMILALRESVDELSAEMHKAAGSLPPTTVIPPSASSGDLEERFRTCAAQLKANILQDCTRTFDLCKVTIKNQTPPSSLSELERSDFVRESEWKRQEELEELKKQLQKTGDDLQKLREELSTKETDHELKKQLEDAGTELKTVKEELSAKQRNNGELLRQLQDKGAELQTVMEELSVKELHNGELLRQLQNTETELRTVKEELSLKELDHRDTKRKLKDAEREVLAVDEELRLREATHNRLKMDLQEAQEKMSVKEKHMKREVDDIGKQLEKLIKDMSINEANHENYMAEVQKEKESTELEIQLLKDESAAMKSQIQSLLDEVKLYKSKLGDTIMDLTSTRREADSLKEQCTKFVQDLNFVENEKVRLLECITGIREELEKKRQSSDSLADAQHDVLVQEFLKKSEELKIAIQQVESFQEEVSYLNMQRTTLQKELLEARQKLEERRQKPAEARQKPAEARQKPASCEKPCCTFEITPNSNQPDNVIGSILEALEQSHKENKQLKQNLETEKQRSQGLDEKLQTAAGKHRSLYMEKIMLENRMKELLRSN